MLPAGKFWMDSRSTSLIKSREHGDNGRGGGDAGKGYGFSIWELGRQQCDVRCNVMLA